VGVLSLSQRLLPVLQLTRMALVSTALADSGCELLLWAQNQPLDVGAQHAGPHIWQTLDLLQCVSMALVSIGLYGFGMSLNDIIDQRRDRQLAAHRPLPSGRIGVITAHFICGLLGLMALVAGAYYANGRWGNQPPNQISLALVVFTGALIIFYDYAGKYLVAPGLITLGLVRFFHACIAAPALPVLWHPLLLLNHVTILSAVAYHWEQKRPALQKIHWWSVFGGLAAFDIFAVSLVYWRRQQRGQDMIEALSLSPGLLVPLAAVVLFLFIALLIRIRYANTRAAGQTLMLFGLLWLIVYDSCFVIGYVGILPGLLLLVYLPIAYMSVLVMRWWSQIMVIGQRPPFRRVET